MLCAWLSLGDGRVLKDLEFNGTGILAELDQDTASISLSYIGLIEPSRIPLHLCSSHHLLVESIAEDTRSWLTGILDTNSVQQTDSDSPSSSLLPESYYETPVGILLKMVDETPSVEHFRGTELLIYGIRDYHRELNGARLTFEATNEIILSSYDDTKLGPMILHALCLSSEFTYLDDSSHATASSSVPAMSADPVPPPQNKRDRLTQLFDEAADARKRPRLSTDGRERSMSRASSIMTSPMLPQDGFAFDTLSAPKQPVGVTTIEATECQGSRRISGSALTTARTNLPTPTTIEARPPSRARTLERTNTLLSQSFTADTMLEQQITNRNKEVINRAVLIGMKEYGLKTYKAGTKGRSSDSQAPETPMEEPGEESAQVDPKDVEYKNVYHQTSKSVVFAFRKSIGSTMLRQEAIKEVLDALLAVFCVEPG